MNFLRNYQIIFVKLFKNIQLHHPRIRLRRAVLISMRLLPERIYRVWIHISPLRKKTGGLENSYFMKTLLNLNGINFYSHPASAAQVIYLALWARTTCPVEQNHFELFNLTEINDGSPVASASEFLFSKQCPRHHILMLQDSISLRLSRRSDRWIPVSVNKKSATFR